MLRHLRIVQPVESRHGTALFSTNVNHAAQRKSMHPDLSIWDERIVFIGSY
jgi:hypothetical protein